MLVFKLPHGNILLSQCLPCGNKEIVIMAFVNGGMDQTHDINDMNVWII